MRARVAAAAPTADCLACSHSLCCTAGCSDCAGGFAGLEKLVAEHNPIDRLGRMGGVPVHDMAAQPGELQQVPECPTTAAGGGGEPQTLAIGGGLHEVKNAVAIGGDTGDGTGPEKGRQPRLQAGQCRTAAPLQQPSQMGKIPRGKQGINHVPVGAIPAKNQQAFRTA